VTTFLLDTHVLLWWLGDDAALPRRHRDVLEDSAVEVFASAVSVWEIAIKRALGKLEAPHDTAGAIRDSKIQPLAVTVDHAQAVADLPPHHRDPFDRLLVAQATIDDLTIATVDPLIERYDVATI
jgi:PIN domain nuclease of toxin-antitoxin system